MFYSTGTLLDNPINIKRKYRLPKVCYVPATSATFLAFFAASTISTNETNKAGGMWHLSLYLSQMSMEYLETYNMFVILREL